MNILHKTKTTFVFVFLAVVLLDCFCVPTAATQQGAAGDQQQSMRAVWSISHAYGPTGKTTLEKMRQVAKEDNVNAVEIDMLYHTDRFWAAHDYDECNAETANRDQKCLALTPLLDEVESNPNITMLWIDPKAQYLWKNAENGRTILLADLAEVVRAHVKTKPIWWGLGQSGAISRGDVEELVSRVPLPELEGVSFDYGKANDYYATIQDLYLRARKAGIQHIGHSNLPGFGRHSCFELNKAFAYLAEGKLTRVLSWTINDVATLKGLYLSDGAVVTRCGAGDNDEQQLIGAVEGIISDIFTGVRNQRSVINADPTLRFANSSDVFWTPRSQFGVPPLLDNVLANGGAEMTPLPNHLACSWRLGHTHRAGALSLAHADGRCPGVTAPRGKRYFALAARCGIATFMYQDIVVRGYQSEINAQTMSATVSASFFVGNRTAFMKWFLKVSYVSLAGSNAETFWMPPVDTLDTSDMKGTWVRTRGTVRVPSRAEVIRVSVGADTAATSCVQPQWNETAGTCPSAHLFIDDVTFAFYPTVTPTTSVSASESNVASPGLPTVTSTTSISASKSNVASPGLSAATRTASHQSTPTTAASRSKSPSGQVTKIPTSLTISRSLAKTASLSASHQSVTSMAPTISPTTTQTPTTTGTELDAPKTATQTVVAVPPPPPVSSKPDRTATATLALTQQPTNPPPPPVSNKPAGTATATIVLTHKPSLPPPAHLPTNTLSITPSTTFPILNLTRREYTIRLSGALWSAVMTTNRTALIVAVQEDIGAALGVFPVSRVEIVSLFVGSLVAHFAIASDDKSETDLSNATAVAGALSEAQVFASTTTTYRASGGSAAETLNVLRVTIVDDGQPPTTASPTRQPTTPSPHDLVESNLDGSGERHCETACLVAVIILALMVTVMVAMGVVIVVRRRRKDAEGKTSAAEGRRGGGGVLHVPSSSGGDVPPPRNL